MLKRLLRLRAFIPMVLLLVLLVVGWWLLLDRLVAKGVEEAGASIVGAKVDVGEADVRVGDGVVVLRGLQVANPDAPMTNLVEAREVVANVMMPPLLEKKVVVETLAIRGVRFGTPRATSGALENPPPGSGQLWREVNSWADRIRIPSLSLEGLGGVVDVSALSADSLRTLAHARAMVARVDSMRGAWESRLVALDPRPQLDSARAFVRRLENANPVQLGIAGVTSLVNDGRARLSGITGLRDRLASLDSAVRAGVGALQANVGEFATTRDADLAYARSLLRLPSLEAPSLSPGLFGETAVTWMKPVLYWVRAAERFVPPGLDPKRFPGPRRARAPGTTVHYPGRATYPRFLLLHGETDFAIGGTGTEAGNYVALVRGLSSAPALYGRPIEIAAARTGAVRGPRDVRLAAQLAHGERPLRDSVMLQLSGVGLPGIDLDVVGGRLELGQGNARFSLSRVGDQLDAQLEWVANAVTWVRRDSVVASLRVGTAAWGRDLLWRTLAGIRQVEIDMGLRGRIERPALYVRTNLADALAASLRRELGAEIQRAEQQVRAEVDRLVQPRITEARARLQAVRTEVEQVVGQQLQEAQDLRSRLEEELRRVTRGIPGLRIP